MEAEKYEVTARFLWIPALILALISIFKLHWLGLIPCIPIGIVYLYLVDWLDDKAFEIRRAEWK